MRLHYKKLRPYIREVNIRNSEEKKENLLGVSTQKVFIKSIANTVGTDFTTYKIVKKNQFTYIADTSRRGDKIGIAMLDTHDEALVSQAYTVFEIINHTELSPDYLMMWFRRPEFDRYARFKSHGSVREIFDWNEMCEIELPIPDINKQREIVKEYHAILNRIKLNEQLNHKLEETIKTVFNEWFLIDENLDVEMVLLSKYIEFNPKYFVNSNQIVTYVEMSDLRQDSLSIQDYVKKEFTGGSKFENNDTLLARITPCLENGKTAFVNFLNDKEVAFGSTEFIVMKAKDDISPYWIYCLARSKKFRLYAISSMVGSSGRQRVHSDYLKVYTLPKVDIITMKSFHLIAAPIFELIKHKAKENRWLSQLHDILLSRMSKPELIEIEQPV
jgi:type I restriction enzyme S subunit